MKTILVDAVGTFVIEGQGVYEPIHQLLETFPNRKIIVSNANDDELVPFGLIKLPYKLYTLKHYPNKTDPKYFETLLKNYGLTKDDVIYFEHNIDAVNSAQSLGIKSYHYDPEKKDLTILKNFLSENV